MVYDVTFALTNTCFIVDIFFPCLGFIYVLFKFCFLLDSEFIFLSSLRLLFISSSLFPPFHFIPSVPL